MDRVIESMSMGWEVVQLGTLPLRELPPEFDRVWLGWDGLWAVGYGVEVVSLSLYFAS